MKKIFVLFLCVILFPVPSFSAQKTAYPKVYYSIAPMCIRDPEYCQRQYHQILSSELIETNSPRTKWLNPHDVVDLLKLEKGMTILDIGTGKGYFTIPFAEKLEGTGRVYATDIDYANIEDVKERVGDFGLTNVETVLVKKDGVDPFYTKHSFDLIFASYLYYFLRHPEEYFRALRPSLNKDGRICIIQPFNNPDLSFYLDPQLNFVFAKIFSEILTKGENFPIFKRFNKDLQDYILRWRIEGKKEIPLEKREETIDALNQMLLDRNLFFDLLDFSIPENVMEQLEFIYRAYPKNGYLISWLANELTDDRVFDSDRALTDIDKKRLSKLNNVLIRGQLKIGEFLLSGYESPFAFIMAQENAIISTMESAGYKLLEKHKFKPAFLLIFGVAEEKKSDQ